MRNVTLLVFATAIVGFAGMASGGEPQSHAFGHGCFAYSVGEQKNPGHLFQSMKASDTTLKGLNPKQIAESIFGVPSDKVSELIQLRCDNSPS